MEAKIKGLTLKRFKSFVNEHIDFDNPTFLVGPNGSGKSNLLDAIAFLSETMTLPLESAIAKRGGFAALRHRSRTGVDHDCMGLGVDFGRLSNEIASAHYAFVARAVGDQVSVEREQCLISRPDGARCWFDQSSGIVRSNVGSMAPTARRSGLALPTIGSDSLFFDVFDSLRRACVYSIEPSRMREPQNRNGQSAVRRDGSETANILADLQTHEPENLDQIIELLAVATPGLLDVRAQDCAGTNDIVFQQRLSATEVMKLGGLQMSDGTFGS